MVLVCVHETFLALNYLSSHSRLTLPCSASLLDNGEALTADVLLQGTQYCRVHSPVELLAMGRILSEIVRAQPKVPKRVHLDEYTIERLFIVYT